MRCKRPAPPHGRAPPPAAGDPRHRPQPASPEPRAQQGFPGSLPARPPLTRGPPGAELAPSCGLLTSTPTGPLALPPPAAPPGEVPTPRPPRPPCPALSAARLRPPALPEAAEEPRACRDRLTQRPGTVPLRPSRSPPQPRPSLARPHRQRQRRRPPRLRTWPGPAPPAVPPGARRRRSAGGGRKRESSAGPWRCPASCGQICRPRSASSAPCCSSPGLSTSGRPSWRTGRSAGATAGTSASGPGAVLGPARPHVGGGGSGAERRSPAAGPGSGPSGAGASQSVACLGTAQLCPGRGSGAGARCQPCSSRAAGGSGSLPACCDGGGTCSVRLRSRDGRALGSSAGAFLPRFGACVSWCLPPLWSAADLLWTGCTPSGETGASPRLL